jgi:TonB family protein
MIPRPKFWRLALFALAGSLTMLSAFAQTDESVGARKVLMRVTPQYPAIARRMSISGSVRLDVLVAPNGSVKVAEIKGGHPVLAQAAQAAVREWKYEPGSRETHETVEVKFAPQ